MDSSNNRIILGLDISTTCTGVSILSVDDNNDFKVELVDRCKFKNKSNITGTEALFYKSQQFKDFITEHNIGFTDIVIEEPLPNSQNRNTLTSLLKFNGMLSQSIYESTGIVPKYISSYDARRFAFPELVAVRKFNKAGEIYPAQHIRKALKKSELVLFGSYSFDCHKKLIMWNLVSDMFPGVQWVYDKKGELAKENFDASDSLVCVLGFLNMEKYGNESEPVVTDFREENDGNNGTLFTYNFKFAGKEMTKTLNIPK